MPSLLYAAALAFFLASVVLSIVVQCSPGFPLFRHQMKDAKPDADGIYDMPPCTKWAGPLSYGVPVLSLIGIGLVIRSQLA